MGVDRWEKEERMEGEDEIYSKMYRIGSIACPFTLTM
jgi:hypothetical protein